MNRPGPVRAITFDFWRTLFYAGSRLRERRAARVDAVVRHTGATPAAAKEIMKFVASEFLRVHVYEQRTLSPPDAIPIIEKQLAISIGADTASVLSTALADAIKLHPPEPIEGALDAVRAASELGPVGLISDTGLSHGAALLPVLERFGFQEHFTCFTFSDDVGVSKPNSAMFHHAAAGLHVPVNELLHIGDLEPTDVVGALNVGARAALFTGDNDRFRGSDRAHHEYRSWADFSRALPRLFG